MKNHIKILTVLGIFAFFTQTAFAQPVITLEGFGGWLWTAKAGYNGSVKVDDKGNYGIRAGIAPKPQMVVEFEWMQTQTTLQYFDLPNQREDVTLNYYMLGFNQELSEGPAVPFGIFNIGIMNMKGHDINFSENWFTVGIGGGLKYYLSEKIGIRLQARLFLPMQFAGVGFGCGSYGCGSGVSGYATTIQGDFTGGLILKLGGS